MATQDVVWPIITGVLGVMLKSAWDSYVGWHEKLRVETWRIRTNQLEERLSKFYWPLYIRLLRDDNVWRKVFFDLRGEHEKPSWSSALNKEVRSALSLEIEKNILLPNHIEATQIITSSMHLAGADSDLRAMLLKYVRHVDIYHSMRSAGIGNVNPIDVGEEFPHGLSDVVAAKLGRYQEEYETLLRERPTDRALGARLRGSLSGHGEMRRTRSK